MNTHVWLAPDPRLIKKALQENVNLNTIANLDDVHLGAAGVGRPRWVTEVTGWRWDILPTGNHS